MKIKSIRSFIGAKNYQLSREFYGMLGFKEVITSAKMSYFKYGGFGFYLQDYYTKEWVENSMIFLEVADAEQVLRDFQKLDLKNHFPTVKVSTMQVNDWGMEFFMHDPSGVLWHIGQFNN